MQALTCHLHALGHRDLAILLPDLPNTTVTGHARGWSDGRAACALPELSAPVLRYADPTGEDEHNSYRMARAVLTLGLPGTGRIPTALVGFNDWCALGILRAAQDLGVAVPAQLSVVGFDNTLIGTATRPPMCSFQPQSFQMGQHAARLLAAQLGGATPAPRRVVVPVDFVCRGSCGPVSAAVGTQ